MIDWLRNCGPTGWALLLGTPIVFLGLRTRFAGLARILGFLLVACGLEAACFDGQPHVGQKFDGTFFVWMRAVELRAAGGVTVLLLSFPLGHGLGTWAGVRGGGLAGLLGIGSVGMGLLGSSLYLRTTAFTVLGSESSPAERMRLIGEAVSVSSGILFSGMTVSLLTAAVTGFFLLLRRTTS